MIMCCSVWSEGQEVCLKILLLCQVSLAVGQLLDLFKSFDCELLYSSDRLLIILFCKSCVVKESYFTFVLGFSVIITFWSFFVFALDGLVWPFHVNTRGTLEESCYILRSAGHHFSFSPCLSDACTIDVFDVRNLLCVLTNVSA